MLGIEKRKMSSRSLIWVAAGSYNLGKVKVIFKSLIYWSKGEENRGKTQGLDGGDMQNAFLNKQYRNMYMSLSNGKGNGKVQNLKLIRGNK